METLSIFDELMLRGERLRALRLLALADEEERAKALVLVEDTPQIKLVDFTSTSTCSDYRTTCCPISNIEILEENNKNLQKQGVSGTCTSIGKNEVSEETTTTTTTTTSDSSTSLPTKKTLTILEDRVDILPDSNLSVLRYESYLSHQRYYDGYKHCNHNFIDFNVTRGKRLILEQQKDLGKGGIVWDSSIVLVDHLLANESRWKKEGGNDHTCKMVDLGAGVGLAGMAMAKAASRTEVHVTDLPEMVPIMIRNISRNFNDEAIVKGSDESSETKMCKRVERGVAARDIPQHFDQGCKSLSKTDILSLYQAGDEETLETMNRAHGKVKAKCLRWGVKEDYSSGPYDVIIGADVIASLYDPTALAHTIYDLCHEGTRIYIGIEKRLSDVVEKFLNVMRDIFTVVVVVKPQSRNRNNNIVVLEAYGKMDR